MTREHLQTKLAELEALVQSGKDYALTEIQAWELLKVLPLGEDLGGVNIGTLS